MEQQVLAATTETLIPGLSYIEKPTASYVTGRSSNTYFPSGGNTYSPSGVRVLRFEIQTDYGNRPKRVRRKAIVVD